MTPQERIMEFESDNGMAIKGIIVTGGELDIINAEGLCFTGCDFESVKISCEGGKDGFLKMASGCRFDDCSFHNKLLPEVFVGR